MCREARPCHQGLDLTFLTEGDKTSRRPCGVSGEVYNGKAVSKPRSDALLDLWGIVSGVS